ncbi:MAG: hypothetical protein LBC74_15030, partial [Planctomycetaceae bacterium]|nr:hypothetical protein [Planctomycetaceae bacterium]
MKCIKFVVSFLVVCVVGCMGNCIAANGIQFESVRESAMLMRNILTDLPVRISVQNLKNVKNYREKMVLIEQLRKTPQIGDDGVKRLIIAQFTSYMYQEGELIQSFGDAIVPSNWRSCLRIISHIFVNNVFELNTRYQTDISDGIYIVLQKSNNHVLDFSAIIEWENFPYPGSSHLLSLDFEQVGLYDLAWRIQIEEGPDFQYEVSPEHDFSVLYNEHRSFYLRAANNAYRAGNKKLGWSFLMYAATLEDEQSFEKAMQLAKLWIDVEASKKELSEQKIQTGDERKKTFLRIVEHYKKRQLHSRAWLFIQEHKNEFDDADNLIKKVQNDWITFIKSLQNFPGVNKIILLGVEFYPTKNDPLSVKIPWPFPEGSIDKSKAKIQETANKIKEDENVKNGLINWYFKSGILPVRAKYIYCNDKEVIVERENGKKETIEIAQLADGNKNYVY